MQYLRAFVGWREAERLLKMSSLRQDVQFAICRHDGQLIHIAHTAFVDRNDNPGELVAASVGFRAAIEHFGSPVMGLLHDVPIRRGVNALVPA